jgi:HEAT repeat protein
VKRGLLVNVTLSLVVSVAFLTALEGLARFGETPRAPEREVADYIWDWDAKMPGGFYVMASESAGWPRWQEFNADGLRDRTRPREKPGGVWRTVVLGDSVTLGAELKPREAYPRLLEARLAAEGQRIEVMSVALWGWSTRQERIAWQRIARGYEPDQAILAVCLNDIPELHNNLSRPPGWLVWLHERSALVRLLVNAEGREIEDVERLFDSPDAPRVKEALDRFFDEVRALRAEVEADGATFAMVVFPFRFQVVAEAPSPLVQEQISSFCRSEEMTCLDMLPTLKRAGPSSFRDYDHLTALGSSLTADTLQASGLLPEGYSNPAVLEEHFAEPGGPEAVGILGWLEARAETPGKAGVLALAQALETGDEPLRLAAAWGLETIGAEAAGARDALVEALGADESAGVRAAAARALGALGDGGRPAVAALFETLGQSSEAVRHAAAQALSQQKLDSNDIPHLAVALQSEDVYVRAFAAWRLGNFREEARGAVPVLALALEQPDTYAVVSAALARIGPAAEEAVPALVSELESPAAGRRWRAARTLGRIGLGAADAVPALTAALEDPNEGVRLRVARALGRIGPDPRSAAALQRATGDPDAGVRREAQEALDRLH